MFKKVIFATIALVSVVAFANAQQPRSACEETRDGLAIQIAQQGTHITEQQRLITSLKEQIAKLTPAKDSKELEKK